MHAKTLENRLTTDATEVDELDAENLDGCGTEHLRQKEQDFVERIIHGAESGHYFMILGCKVSLRLLSPRVAYLLSHY